jgi:hypothetical protein
MVFLLHGRSLLTTSSVCPALSRCFIRWLSGEVVPGSHAIISSSAHRCAFSAVLRIKPEGSNGTYTYIHESPISIDSGSVDCPFLDR